MPEPRRAAQPYGAASAGREVPLRRTRPAGELGRVVSFCNRQPAVAIQKSSLLGSDRTGVVCRRLTPPSDRRGLGGSQGRF
jgi:hypothetical protein